MHPALENEWYESVDPDNAWKDGWGTLVRLRSIFGATALDVVLSAISWYSGFGWKVAVGIAVSGGLLISALVILRKVRIYTVNVGGAFHRLCDGIREDAAGILSAASSQAPAWYETYRGLHNRFHDDVADRIALFFRAMVGDQTINCAIRLAQSRDGQEVYATAGRSMEMCPSRKERTQPLPGNRGIALFLRNKLHRGVSIIRDIQDATKKEMWHALATDSLPDVKTLMIAPINGYGYSEARLSAL